MNTQFPFWFMGTSRTVTPPDRAPAKISTIKARPNPL